jgi:hypothetical protein
MDNSQPRINGAQMGQFLGRNVTLICEMAGETDQNGNPKMVCPDGTVIFARLPAGERIGTRFVQMDGKVADSTVLDVTNLTAVGDDFNMGNYDKGLGLMHGQYQHLFAV